MHSSEEGNEKIPRFYPQGLLGGARGGFPVLGSVRSEKEGSLWDLLT
jgi:hypothetical protein